MMIEYEICSYCGSVTETWYVDEDDEICCPDCHDMFEMYGAITTREDDGDES